MTDLAALLAALRETEAVVIAAFESTPRKRRRAVALVEMYCHGRASCLLWTAWATPAGALFYSSPYKLSPTRNQTQSSSSGRAANTTDGDRHWKPQAGAVDKLRGWGDEANVMLQCDHHAYRVPFDDLCALVDGAAPGRPTRPSMEKYVVSGRIQ